MVKNHPNQMSWGKWLVLGFTGLILLVAGCDSSIKSGEDYRNKLRALGYGKDSSSKYKQKLKDLGYDKPDPVIDDATGRFLGGAALEGINRIEP
jgi:hypothetical protein